LNTSRLDDLPTSLSKKKILLLLLSDVGVTPLASVSEDWIDAIFTPADALSPEQVVRTAESDACVAELVAADVIVIGVATYNFNIASTLKSWIDNVARSGKTFQYGDAGPEGLLKGKRVVICRASGGTAEDAPINFSTSYLKFMMGFMGITDVTFVHAATMGEAADANFAAAVADVQKLTF
jgi:FMN-dependent NADH-azoreductase